MKKLLTTTAICAALATPARAQLGFVTGMALGSAMVSPSSKDNPGEGDVIYRAAPDIDRKIDIQNVYFGRCYAENYPRVADCFTKVLYEASAPKMPGGWDILEIRRVRESGGNGMILWFTFTPKAVK